MHKCLSRAILTERGFVKHDQEWTCLDPCSQQLLDSRRDTILHPKWKEITWAWGQGLLTCQPCPSHGIPAQRAWTVIDLFMAGTFWLLSLCSTPPHTLHLPLLSPLFPPLSSLALSLLPFSNCPFHFPLPPPLPAAGTHCRARLKSQSPYFKSLKSQSPYFKNRDNDRERDRVVTRLQPVFNCCHPHQIQILLHL